jgi:predicted PurR-regulated permease PerM
MSIPEARAEREAFVSNALEASVRIGLIALLAFYSLQIVKPFVAPVLWGVVIAISTRSFYRRLEAAVGGRSSLAATVFALIGLGLVIGPAVALMGTIVGSVEELALTVESGQAMVPPPPEQVAGWPLIGPTIDRFWSLASGNLEAALQSIDSQLATAALWILNAAADAGLGVLLFALSIVIAAALHTNAEAGGRVAQAAARRVAGDRGPALTSLAESTIRGVTRGVLGVALIQALASGIGMLAVDVPAAGLWALMVLLMAVMQLPTLLLLLPIAIYVFSYASTLPAVLFLIWSLLTALSDNVLKPMLLARGVDVPMLVVLIGALGGFASIGLIGLFVGPIVVAVGYTLLGAWIELDEETLEEEATAGET